MPKNIKIIILFLFLTIGITTSYLYFYNSSSKENIKEDIGNDEEINNTQFLSLDNQVEDYIPLIGYWLTHLIIIIIITVVVSLFLLNLVITKRKECEEVFKKKCNEVLTLMEQYISDKMAILNNLNNIPKVANNKEAKEFTDARKKILESFFLDDENNKKLYEGEIIKILSKAQKDYQNFPFYTTFKSGKKERLFAGSRLFFRHSFFAIVFIFLSELLIFLITYLFNEKYSLLQIFFCLSKILFQDKKSFFNLVIMFFPLIVYLLYTMSANYAFLNNNIYLYPNYFFDAVIEKNKDEFENCCQKFLIDCQKYIEFVKKYKTVEEIEKSLFDELNTEKLD